MLREIFFGKENSELVANTNLVDAEPREVYIISCLLVPIIGIGLYPKLMTDSYRASIEALVQRDMNAMEKLNQKTYSSGKSMAASASLASVRKFHFPLVLNS